MGCASTKGSKLMDYHPFSSHTLANTNWSAINLVWIYRRSVQCQIKQVKCLCRLFSFNKCDVSHNMCSTTADKLLIIPICIPSSELSRTYQRRLLWISHISLLPTFPMLSNQMSVYLQTTQIYMNRSSFSKTWMHWRRKQLGGWSPTISNVNRLGKGRMRSTPHLHDKAYRQLLRRALEDALFIWDASLTAT